MRAAAHTSFARDLRQRMTDAENRLWFHLRRRGVRGHRFRRQHPVGPYIADFACIEAGLVVELDGSQHLASRTDAQRDACIRRQGFRVLRFWNDEVLLRLDDVLEAIRLALADQDQERPLQPLRGSFPRSAGAATAEVQLAATIAVPSPAQRGKVGRQTRKGAGF